MAEGMHYVRRHKMLLGCISLDLFAVLLGGATAMLPVYARDILHDSTGLLSGSAVLGVLRAAPGAGAALMAILLTRYPIRDNVGVKMLIAVAIFGLSTAIFGISHWLPLSLLMLFLLGCADMVSVFIRGTLNQLYTPDDMRGRVSAISGLFISASNELGEAESGLLAAAVGPMVAVVAGGLGAIGITLLWYRLFPEIRNTHNFTPPALETLR
jgi:MFS family permease